MANTQPTAQPLWSKSWTRKDGHQTISLVPMEHGAAVLRWCDQCSVEGGAIWDRETLGLADDLMMDLLARVLGWALTSLGFDPDPVR